MRFPTLREARSLAINNQEELRKAEIELFRADVMKAMDALAREIRRNEHPPEVFTHSTSFSYPRLKKPGACRELAEDFIHQTLPPDHGWDVDVTVQPDQLYNPSRMWLEIKVSTPEEVEL